MDDTTRDHLRTLHTAAIDASNGYKEALEDADGQSLMPLFADMVALHQRHADELARVLTEAGDKADDGGSFMSTVHKTIMDIRSLFGGLDESVLPGLIDGEKRNIATYDEAINGAPPPSHIEELIGEQRGDLARKVADMEAMKTA